MEIGEPRVGCGNLGQRGNLGHFNLKLHFLNELFFLNCDYAVITFTEYSI